MNLRDAVRILRSRLSRGAAGVEVSTSDGGPVKNPPKDYPFVVTCAGPNQAALSPDKNGYMMAIGLTYQDLIALRKQVDELIREYRPLRSVDDE